MREILAYLLTLAEAFGHSPVYGRVWMEQVWLAFTTPDDLRAMLDGKLKKRFDYWLANTPESIASSDQLDMFL